jgi:chaperonin GroEL
MIKKINLSDEVLVREKIAHAISKMAELVGMTLGPTGRSVLIERGTAEPLIVDDGRRVAENIKFDDPIEQLAVRVCYGVTRKTDEKAGDGTTTSMILANAILQEIHKMGIGGIGVNANLNDIDEQIQKAKVEVFNHLDTEAKPVKTEKELIDVATIAVGNEELGKIIGSMFYQMGKDGHISLEFNLLSSEIENEVVSGYRFSGGYAANWMITNEIRKDCVFPDTDVLITKQKITDFKDLVPVLNAVGNSNKKKMAIIAPKFSDSVLRNIYLNATRQQSPFTVLAIRAPGRNEEAYKDMAIFTGAKYFSENDDLKLATKEDLGYVARIEATDDTTMLIEGKGKKDAIDKRIKEVQAEAAKQKLPQFKQDRYERIAALQSAAGVIKIGAPTDEERNWLKYKIEDAKYATKQAFKEGIVRGGGLTFKKIADKLPTDNILKKALEAPYEKLKANAGGNFTVGKNVIDPVTVEKAALENACSAVSKLMRIGGAIAMVPQSLTDELKNLINSNAQQHGEELIQDDNE